MLVPIQGGFEVYVRDQRQLDIDLSVSNDSEPKDLLVSRQRFSFAHEIAHTFFYKFKDGIPVMPTNELKIPQLETQCDRTASRILVPTNLLRREVQDPRLIDKSFILAMAAKFSVSLKVMINRLAEVEQSNPTERCVVLAKRIQNEAQIQAIYYCMGLLPTLPPPIRYTRITEWLPDIPVSKFTHNGDHQWQINRKGRPVAFHKTELGNKGYFLLQAEVG